MLEAVRNTPVKHLLIASTSSVYGANTHMPYAETDKADSQMSFYAATKKATEAMAHSYAHLYRMPTTMFRFFTVYGPWGRPDMAPIKFTKAIMNGDPIDVYNHGNMSRDFTYIDDLIEGLFRLIPIAPERPDSSEDIPEYDSLSAVAPFRIVNIGNAQPVQLMDFITAIEAATGRDAVKHFKDMQPGDVAATWADTTLLQCSYWSPTQNPDHRRRHPLRGMVPQLLRQLTLNILCPEVSQGHKASAPNLLSRRRQQFRIPPRRRGVDTDMPLQMAARCQIRLAGQLHQRAIAARQCHPRCAQILRVRP